MGQGVEITSYCFKLQHNLNLAWVVLAIKKNEMVKSGMLYDLAHKMIYHMTS